MGQPMILTGTQLRIIISALSAVAQPGDGSPEWRLCQDLQEAYGLEENSTLTLSYLVTVVQGWGECFDVDVKGIMEGHKPRELNS